ncbi:MAG: YkgJ family cysteine cluster protein [Treponema sp.]|nr:YkgJ family cysteine cluster protein [Treponema sp.]
MSGTESTASTESEKKFYDGGLKFSCRQCSFCCRGFPGVVLMDETDLERLAKWSDVTREQFIQMYCRWVESDDGFEYLSLREKRNMECIFWNNGCESYEARPVQCRTYPFWTKVLESRETWDEEGKSCPGINSGENHPQEEIETELSKYQARNPIKRRR